MVNSALFFRRDTWLGLLTCKNRLPYNLYCVGGDVKHCSLTHSLTHLMPSHLLREANSKQDLFCSPFNLR